MNYNKLSADPTSLILGIISIVIVILGCCCGFFVIISLVLGIVGLVLANKSLSEYDQFPESYSHQSRKNVYAGKVLSIIGTVLSSVITILFLVVLFFYQMSFSSIIKDKFEKFRNKRDTIDSIYIKQSNDGIYEEKDTTYTDSIKIEEIK